MRKLPRSKNDMTHEEWLEVRRKGIGGSDIAGILGHNQYKSPLTIYLDKTNQEIPEDKENVAAEVGLELEPYLSKKFVKWMADKEGIDIELFEMPEVLQHDKIDYFLVNLDRWFVHPQRGNCVVELKTTTEFKRDLWVGDEVPDQYYCQVQWQLMVTGFKWGYLVVLIGNRIVDVKLIPRNETFIKTMAKTGKQFWAEFVMKNIPPAPTGTDSDDSALKALYPEEEPGTVMKFEKADEKMLLKIIVEIDGHSEKKRIAEAELKRLKQIVKWKMGEYETGFAGDKKISLKTINVPGRTQAAYSFRKLDIRKVGEKDNGKD